MLRITASALVLLAFANLCAAQTTDPAIGKWIGLGGVPTDRIEIGLEFTAGADGKLTVLGYLPVLNLFGAQLTLQREGELYKIPELSMELSFKDGKLTGVATRRQLPITFERTDKLPSDPDVPDLPKGPEPLWKTKLGGMVFAPVAVREGIAYIGTTGGVFNAINVKDGTFAWTFSAGRPIHGEAEVSPDAVYFTCDNGFLFRLNRSDGKEVWRYDLGDAQVSRVVQHQAVFEWDYLGSRPVLRDGALYVGSGDGSVHAVDAATGKRIWRFATKGKVRTDALVDANRVYIGSLDGILYALDRKDGKEVWRYDTTGPVTSSASFVDGKVVVGNRGPGLYALNPGDGSVAWRAPFWGSWVESSAVQYENLFYIGASDLRRVTCYDPKDGHVVWRTDVFGWSWGRPLVTDKLVYVGVAGGSPYVIRHVPSLTALDRRSGKIVWRWVPPDGSDALQWGFPAGPVLEGKTLVIAALNGMLYAFPIGS